MPKYDNIEDLARSLYEDDGPNQWPHIQRVLAQAEQMADKRGKPLTQLERTAILLHDIGKDSHSGEDHGVVGGRMARELLRGMLPPHSIATVANAIADHNMQRSVPRSQLSDLLRSADANKPDLAWYLRKSYNKMTETGKLSHEEALKNAYRRVQQGYATLDKGDIVCPKLYAEAFAKQLAQMRQQAQTLKYSDVAKLIARYNKENPNESIYG